MMTATAMAQNREVTVITELGDAVDKVELYAGPELYTGSWSNYPKAEFKESVAAGNVIKVHVRGDEGASGQYLQSLYKSDEGTVDHLCIGNNEWRCAGVSAGESVVSYTIASPEEADAINHYGYGVWRERRPYRHHPHAFRVFHRHVSPLFPQPLPPPSPTGEGVLFPLPSSLFP